MKSSLGSLQLVLGPLSRVPAHYPSCGFTLCVPDPQPQLQVQSLLVHPFQACTRRNGQFLPGLREESGSWVGWRGVLPWAGGDGSDPMAALRKARRQEQLVSKRLLREDSAAEEGGQDRADVVPDPLSEDEVKNLPFYGIGGPGGLPQTQHMKEAGRGQVWEWF